ncbi:glycosyltransferase involved in cell wall biosynthesis [Marinobacter pelagius]|uniref:Glycosyltransferase involved in cell wall biosynthesis n=1 Tax=Marinobacter pelagius TaxID=379482 RepID=A0A366GGJ1_9GAMM|nr:glycosyltransferase family 4 protein [Marinobacter pelagius]RBP25009.1 glycosyltransferase involved in cell wall biosynthesis [Marinobacter pelagius]
MKSVVFLTSNTSWYLYNFRRSSIQALQEQGSRVICLSPPDDFSQRLVDELGAEHIALPLDGKSTGAVQELRSLRFIWTVMRQYRPDFVFNFTVKMNIYCGLVCALQKIPFANNISGLGTAFIHDSWLFRRVRQVYGLVNRRARHLFFQNEEDLSVFRDKGMLGDTPYTLLPGSGVNLQRFATSPLPESGPFTFIMIARLLGDKGVREYAEACRVLKAEGLGVRCLLVGPLGVSNRTAISEEEVAKWQAEGVLEYLGATDDVRPLIERSHVLVLPSYREGMPRTVLEAAAMGRPAIVTDVPGCRHAVEAGVTGWLCEVRSAGALAAVMRQVVEMDRGELQGAGDAARRRMEDEFSEEVVVEAYLGCLDREVGVRRMNSSDPCASRPHGVKNKQL